MSEAFVRALLTQLASSWAKKLGAKKLREMALTPGHDLHVSFKNWFHYDVYVNLPVDKINPALAKTRKRLVTITIGSDAFVLWYVKGDKHG